MPPPVPASTYRLQLSRDFGFDAAANIVPYLKALGISHLYTSPFLTARPGSVHGYDVVDFRTLNPEFGGDEAFDRLSTALRDADMGLILDFVPNHMAVGSDNALWLDVLEWGARSPHAASFDISWDLLPYRRSGGVLLPVLGRPYGDALTAGEIELRFDPQQGSFSAWYFDHRFPINPQRYDDIIKTVVVAANENTTSAGRALLALGREHATLGRPTYAQAPALKANLAALPGAAEIIARGLAAYRPDREGGVNLLHRLLERQHYRLADWRLAVSAINYRRFFDINDLAGVRVEDAATFRMMHEFVLRLVAEDRLQGLRLDHIDGLFDPAQYARRLRQVLAAARGPRRPPVYVIAEKILADGETMPALPGIAGTTGYEWLNTISRVLVDATGRDRLDALWRQTEPGLGDFQTVLRGSKERVLNGIMASEANVLAQLLSRIAAGHYSTRDYAPDRLRSALRLYILEFPVYRTYVSATGPGERDRTVIERAIAAARRRWQGTDADIFDFLRDALTLDLIRDGRPYSRPRVRQFAFKMQQFTGPMAAKSLEDTAIYRYHALLGLNEVGGDPSLPALSIAEFHERMQARVAQGSAGLTATATHDTKRGEDARMRILALSEIPDLWAEHVRLWREINARLIGKADGRYTPSSGHEYLIYQALIGVWPHGRPPDASFAQRFEDYAIKAAREGKLETNWLNPDERYEDGLRSFVKGILDAEASRAFLASFADVARRAALLGALNSLAQLVLKATMPGVPDFYQGTELWDLALVDPDNRRPVDFTARQAMLAALPSASAGELADNWTDGRIKMALTRRLLQLRAEHPDAFRNGAYETVAVTSPHRDHVIAFKRSWQRSRFLVIVGRHYAALTSRGEHWPAGDYLNGLELDRKDFASAAASENLLSGVLHGLPIAILRAS
ncbi:MAG: malto-oligosyltrehalose synthase [Xanthobacteraceae bacterium]|nr:malto-oligosyltrehalose synthase [Xanthobacteraceae bacterium]